MAKLTIEEAKVKLARLQPAVESLQNSGIPVPDSLLKEYQNLEKIIAGSSSDNLVKVLNEKIADKINSNEEFKNFICSLVGTRARVALVVNTDEKGVKTIKFEVGNAAGGGQKAGTSVGGGTKSATAYNNYKVTVIGNLPDYPTKEATFTKASETVKFILNGGKNPLNLGAEFGAGNSMVRVLEGLANGKNTNEAFNANFKLEMSRVEEQPKEPATTEAAAPATPATPAE